MLDQKKLALVHLAAKRLGLSDEKYRELLRRWGGVESASDLDGAGFSLVMQIYFYMGFTSDAARRNYGHRPGMASFKQVNFMRSLWSDVTDGTGDDAALGHWLLKHFKISHLRFVDAALAPRVIAALLSWKNRKSGGGGQAA